MKKTTAIKTTVLAVFVLISISIVSLMIIYPEIQWKSTPRLIASLIVVVILFSEMAYFLIYSTKKVLSIGICIALLLSSKYLCIAYFAIKSGYSFKIALTAMSIKYFSLESASVVLVNMTILLCVFGIPQILSDWKKVRMEMEQRPQKQEVEYKMRCNVCGKIYCYTKSDISDNVTNGLLGAISAIAGVWSAMSGNNKQSLGMGVMSAHFNGKAFDYTKCPYCHSADIAEMKEECNSAIEDIKKYKELLDTGIITQEEFDAKKKQLLDL